MPHLLPPPSMPAQLLSGLLQIRHALLEADAIRFLLLSTSFKNICTRDFRPMGSPIKLPSPLNLTSRANYSLIRDLSLGIGSLKSRLFSSSSQLLDSLHVIPLKAIPSFSPLAILRWSIDSEPDLHFRLRPHLSRSTQCRCGCGKHSSIYPFGIVAGAYHAFHFTYYLLYTLNLLLRPGEPSPASLDTGIFPFLPMPFLHSGKNGTAPLLLH